MKHSAKTTIRPCIVGGKLGRESFVACMDCYDRHPGCHSKCEKYLSAKKEYTEKMWAIRTDHFAEYDATDYAIRRATEMKRFGNGKGHIRTEDALKRRGI